MKIIAYFGHPAQYLFFRETAKRLLVANQDVLLLIKAKDVLENLILADGLPYLKIQEQRKAGTFHTIWALLKREWEVFKIARRFQPDILIGTDPLVAHIGTLLRKKSIITLEDDYYVIPKLAKIAYPFATYIFTPFVCQVGKRYESKKIGYNGYMKLAYLHPDVFTPDFSLIKDYVGMQAYSLIRLSALTAHHDTNIQGIDQDLLDTIIHKLEAKGRVFISAEKPLPHKYQTYRLTLPPHLMHHCLAHASILVSDSQSMSVESALLGVPSIRISTFAGKISILEEMEKSYRLTFGFPPEKTAEIIQKLDAILEENISTYKERQQELLKDKDNVNDILYHFITSNL